jgi:hypothetical protein
MMMYSSGNHEYKHHENSPWAGFDLTIAQTQIKDWEDSISKEEILSCFNMNTSKHPLITKEQSQIELLYFQLSKLLFKLNQLVQGIQNRFLEKEPI